MKKKVSLKILIILIIIAICLISFVGIYKKDKFNMENVLPDYMLSMNLSGAREVILKFSDETEEVIYDSEGNVSEDGLDEEGNLKEGYTKQDEKVNKDEVLTEENYAISKVMIEERLKTLGVEDYTVRLDNKTGKITINIPEDTNTDNVISNLTYKGKFEIIDSNTKEVLIDNNDVKESKAVYATQDNGTTVYLSIEFNKEGKKKLEEITKTYVSSTDEEGNDTTKKIAINLDDEQLLETYFGQTITSGFLQLTVGSASTSSETISSYIEQASQIASLITNNKMEIQYEVESDTYLSTLVNEGQLKVIVIIILSMIAVALIYLCVRYKTNGLLASISYIGFMGVLLIVLRYTNVVISLEGIMGMIVILIANYVFTNYVLNKMKKNKELSNSQIIKETFMHYVWILLPLLIIAVVFTFIKWTPVASIGMIMFWGLVILFVYNYIITKTLLEK